MNFLNKLINNFLNNKESKSFQNTLEIPSILTDFVADEVLPGLNITPEYFWYKFEGLLDDFSSRNKDLLKVRSDLQKKINEWHIKNKGENFNFKEYKEFDPDLQKVSQRVGNQFPQLSWILPLLNKNDKYFSTTKSSLLATSENTNSYSALKEKKNEMISFRNQSVIGMTLIHIRRSRRRG